MKEIKREILNSEQLRAHFEDNPTDMRQLRHDNHLQPHKIQQHLKYVLDVSKPLVSVSFPTTMWPLVAILVITVQRSDALFGSGHAWCCSGVDTLLEGLITNPFRLLSYPIPLVILFLSWCAFLVQ